MYTPSYKEAQDIPSSSLNSSLIYSYSPSYKEAYNIPTPFLPPTPLLIKKPKTSLLLSFLLLPFP